MSNAHPLCHRTNRHFGLCLHLKRNMLSPRPLELVWMSCEPQKQAITLLRFCFPVEPFQVEPFRADPFQALASPLLPPSQSTDLERAD